MQPVKGRLEWIAVSESRWELHGEQGRKLGALVKFAPHDTAPATSHTWAALPRGGNYLEPKAQVRDAALMLLDIVARPSAGASES